MPEIVILLCRSAQIRPWIELVLVLLYITDHNPRRGSVGGGVKWVEELSGFGELSGFRELSGFGVH